MPTADDWREARDALVRSGDPRRGPGQERLYELARLDGERMLGGRFSKLPQDERSDLIHDVLIKIFDKLLAPEMHNPRGMFLVSLSNQATSWFRKRRAEPVDEIPEGRPDQQGAAADADFVLDARRGLEELSPRDQAVMVAVALGEDRNEIARAYGLTRAHVDKIVSRGRKQLRGGNP